IRDEVETDLRELVNALRQGSTLYLTPEGRMTESGALGRFRAALDRLLPAARNVAVVGTAYDPWASRRLALYVSVTRLERRGAIRDELLARRPITVSQLLSQYIMQHPQGGALEDLAGAARAWAAAGDLPLPAETRRVLDHLRPVFDRMSRRGIITLNADAWVRGPTVFDPRFPHIPNIVEAQAVQLSETLQAIRRMRATPAAVPEHDAGAPATS
ncbi:MAG: hypothetical protein ACP5QO_05370, partial [Clostridia bacterium]